MRISHQISENPIYDTNCIITTHNSSRKLQINIILEKSKQKQFNIIQIFWDFFTLFSRKQFVKNFKKKCNEVIWRWLSCELPELSKIVATTFSTELIPKNSFPALELRQNRKFEVCPHQESGTKSYYNLNRTLCF